MQHSPLDIESNIPN